MMDSKITGCKQCFSKWRFRGSGINVRGRGFWGANGGAYGIQVKKVIYGLKQVPWAFFQKSSSCLLFLGFVKSKSNMSLFYRKTTNSLTVTLVYVDGIIITGDNASLIQQFIELFKENFSLKNLGNLSCFLTNWGSKNSSAPKAWTNLDNTFPETKGVGKGLKCFKSHFSSKSLMYFCYEREY